VIGSSLCIPTPARLTVQEIAMSHLEIGLLATVASLVVTSLGAQAADLRGERYALADPLGFRQTTPLELAVQPRATVVRIAKKKPRPRQAVILTGLQNFRMPAQRALDRLGRPAGSCQPAGVVCPAASRDDPAKSQPRQYAKVPSSLEAEPSISDMAANGEPALIRPFTDVPGFVPGRESIYRFTVNVPMGRDEYVHLQANIRRNAYNTADSSDSTLRADWSLRF
jgi:hypothetical protein